MTDYDVIVIGLGCGGITAAALLAKRGRKTLVLKQAPPRRRLLLDLRARRLALRRGRIGRRAHPAQGYPELRLFQRRRSLLA
jgi:thioredoxin reductase